VRTETAVSQVERNGMRFARSVFRIAGIYGIVVLTPLYFLEQRIGRETPPPITHPEYFYGFIGVALVFQLVFLVVSSDPVRYRPVMIPCVLEKVSYGVALLALMAQHRIPVSVLVVGSVDWVFALLFVVARVKTPVQAK
jgi:hypothetical protein